MGNEAEERAQAEASTSASSPNHLLDANLSHKSAAAKLMRHQPKRELVEIEALSALCQADIEQLEAEVARLKALLIKALRDQPSESQVCMSTHKLVLSLVSGRLPTDATLRREPTVGNDWLDSSLI